MGDTLDNTQSIKTADVGTGRAAGNTVKALNYGVKLAQGDFEGIGTDAAKEITVSTLESDKAKGLAKEVFSVAAKYVPQITATIENSKILKYIPGVAAGAAVLETTVNAGQKYLDGNTGGALAATVQGGMAAAAKAIPLTRLPGVSSFADDIVKEGTHRLAQYAFGDNHPEWVPAGSGIVSGAVALATKKEDPPYKSEYPSATSLAKAHENDAPTFAKAPPMGEQFDKYSVGNTPAQQPGFAPAPVMSVSIPLRQPQVVAGLAGPTPPRPATGWS